MSVAFKRLLIYQGYIGKVEACLFLVPSLAYGTWRDLLQYKEMRLASWNPEPQGDLFFLYRISQHLSLPGQNPWMSLWDPSS